MSTPTPKLPSPIRPEPITTLDDPSCSPSNKGLNTSTLAVRAGIESDPTHGSVMPPLFLSSNYTFDGYKGKRKYDYT
nr:hypothetical protein [Vampirovibrio sp.]